MSVPDPTVSPSSRNFYRLAVGTALLTFLLIVLGTIVRVTDSGLGCGPAGSGTKGWPLCGGRIVPLVDTQMIVEYTHRIVAAAVVAAIALLLVMEWRRHRAERAGRATVWALAIAVGTVLAQAVLGGLTVEKGLHETLVAAHLGIAMVLLAILLFVVFGAQPRRASALPPASGTLRGLTAAAGVAVLATIVSGGYMAGTEYRGAAGHVHGGAHMACGKIFPGCAEGFLPFGRDRLMDIHLIHRSAMYAAALLIVAVFAASVLSRHNRRLVAASALVVAILTGQVLVGASNVWFGEHAWLVTLHMAVGTLLWGSLVFLNLLAARSPEVEVASAPASAGRAQAVTA